MKSDADDSEYASPVSRADNPTAAGEGNLKRNASMKITLFGTGTPKPLALAAIE
jgi:hypothetical protein|tara:strand:- start:378 stop:539 length:162 start_codon:yes stop_codon:yes gene_type:complete